LRGLIGAAVIDENEHNLAMLTHEIDENITLQTIGFVVARDRDGGFSQSFSERYRW
jgi:hypothetical protein